MPPTVLLICDFQAPIRALMPDKPSFDSAASHAASLLRFARTLGEEKVLVIHVIAGGANRTDQALYSVNPNSAIGEFMRSFPASPASPGIIDILAPLPDEQILTRTRASVFHDTPLHSQLRSLAIRQLFLCGVATSGVVLASFRSAIDADYEVAVVGEACADVSREMHQALFGYFAAKGWGGRVVSVQEAMRELQLEG
ncbi:Isochorismatase hydrolase [Calocera viscosa TUFC12733]|uniref:Isochorismatase hydrolase n=1 Tax=Calocera viscosa (strain TUFC12733) TaxID=1330018 RepID=A0A167MUM3_CALVF|nr:Isochorismatase hydrolase [Calocera viscosa TUFC12733]